MNNDALIKPLIFMGGEIFANSSLPCRQKENLEHLDFIAIEYLPFVFVPLFSTESGQSSLGHAAVSLDRYFCPLLMTSH